MKKGAEHFVLPRQGLLAGFQAGPNAVEQSIDFGRQYRKAEKTFFRFFRWVDAGVGFQFRVN